MVAYFALDRKHVIVSFTRKSPLHGHRAAAFLLRSLLYCRGRWHRQPMRRPSTHDPLTIQLSWGRARTLTPAEINPAAAKR
jgi:hypothetical protein